MVQPAITYCSITFTSLSEQKKQCTKRLDKQHIGPFLVHSKKMTIVAGNQLLQLDQFNVHFLHLNPLNRTVPNTFENHFRRLDHAKTTRRNSTDLWVLKVKTESGKRGICYYGTKIFNALPVHIKTEKYYIHFKSAVKEHYRN